MMDVYSKCTHPIICLIGPTATGKTKLAVTLSQNFPVEIISVDSALVYRGMDIGTSKPSIEELTLAPHRLVDIRDPSESYSVADFCHDAHNEIKKITASNRVPLLVGGSMLYFKLLLDGISLLPKKDDNVRENINCEAKQLGWMALYKKLEKIDPFSARKIHYSDHKRLLRALEVFYISKHTLTELMMKAPKRLLFDYSFYFFSIDWLDRSLLYRSIEKRFYSMLERGLENEVKKLFFRPDLHENMASISCIGYRQMWLYLSGKMTYSDMIFKSISATRHLAKHQMTWLRNWSGIHWLKNEKNIDVWIEQIRNIVNLD